jgi:hypothetical protein
MKKHATGNGSSQCVLCADGFGMLGASSVSCVDCHKVKEKDDYVFFLLLLSIYCLVGVQQMLD